MPNLAPIWVDPNNLVWKLIQTSNLIKSNLIEKVNMTDCGQRLLLTKMAGKMRERQVVEMKSQCVEGGWEKATEDAEDAVSIN